MTLISLGRREKFIEPGREQPLWLRDFGSGLRARNFISEVARSSEQCGTLPSARAAAKKRRRSNFGNLGEEQSTLISREQAVGALRSVLLRILSAGRAEARMHIYRNLIFIIEKIRKYSSVAAAKEDGYEFVFHGQGSADEREIPDDVEGTPWDIPVAEVGTADDIRVREKNSALYSSLCAAFPSLRLTLKYKKIVRRGPLDCVEDCDEFGAGDVFLPVEEEVVLHRVALGVIVGAFKAKDYHEVLRSSAQSLRASPEGSRAACFRDGSTCV